MVAYSDNSESRLFGSSSTSPFVEKSGSMMYIARSSPTSLLKHSKWQSKVTASCSRHSLSAWATITNAHGSRKCSCSPLTGTDCLQMQHLNVKGIDVTPSHK